MRVFIPKLLQDAQSSHRNEGYSRHEVEDLVILNQDFITPKIPILASD